MSNHQKERVVKPWADDFFSLRAKRAGVRAFPEGLVSRPLQNIERRIAGVKPGVEDAGVSAKFRSVAFGAFFNGRFFFPGLVVASFGRHDCSGTIFAVPKGHFGGVVSSPRDRPVNRNAFNPVQ